MPAMKQSIIQQIKSEGFDEGVRVANYNNSMVKEEVFYDGQCDARANAPSRIVWFLIGALAVGGLEAVLVIMS